MDPHIRVTKEDGMTEEEIRETSNHPADEVDAAPDFEIAQVE